MKICLPALILGVILTACATSGEPEPRGIAQFEGDARLGEKTDKICFERSIDGFYDNTRDTVVLSSGVSRDYVVSVTGACPSLRFAQSIAMDNRGGSCVSRGDVLIVSENAFSLNDRTGLGPDRCLINEIYKWDRDAVMAGAADE